MQIARIIKALRPAADFAPIGGNVELYQGPDPKQGEPDRGLARYVITGQMPVRVVRWASELGSIPTQQEIEAAAQSVSDAIDAERTQMQQDKIELARLKALPRKDWSAADVRIAVQIWISRQ